MNDPFQTLQLFDGFDATAISRAFAGAIARGVTVAEARAAMDSLRNPLQRAAAELLAPSMSYAARRERAVRLNEDREPGIEIVLRLLSIVADQMDRDLASAVVLPRRPHLVGEMLPALTNHLEP